MSESKFKMGEISVVDLLHLDYGLRAGTSKAGQLVVHLMNTSEIYEFPITERKEYFRFFQSCDIDLVGHEELYVDKNIAHSTWYRFDPAYRGRDPSSHMHYICSGFANALRKEGATDQLAIAENIVFSFRAMEYRLRDISWAYGEQASHAAAGAIKDGNNFADQDTLNVYLNIHSFLVEASTLRDHLAAFLAKRLFHQPDIGRMAKLMRFLKGAHSVVPIASEILSVCDRDSPAGWLARLGALRDCVVHSSPISSLSKHRGMKCERLQVRNISFYSVRLHLPEDPILSPNGPRIDALKQCTRIARNMSDFTRSVITAVGVKPEIVHFTDDDILE